jgi:hypothetical protein
LRRYGMAEAEATINGYLTGTGTPGTFPPFEGAGGGREDTRRTYLAAAEPLMDKHRLFPIPPVEIDLSKVAGQVTLKQNPGW